MRRVWIIAAGLAAVTGCTSDPGFTGVAGVREARPEEVALCRRITDISGRVVMDETMNISNERAQLNTEALTNGVYQVSVISAGSVNTTRMIVRK